MESWQPWVGASAPCPACWGRDGAAGDVGDAEGLFCYSGAIYWPEPTGRSVAAGTGARMAGVGWPVSPQKRGMHSLPAGHAGTGDAALPIVSISAFSTISNKKHQNLELCLLSQLLQCWSYQEGGWGGYVEVAVGGSAAPATVHLQGCPWSNLG